MNRFEVFAGDHHLVTYAAASNAAYFIHSDWQGVERVRSRSAVPAIKSA
jgi:hypothetical protein